MADLHTTLAQRPLGLVFDIDGTLSPIAPTPGEATLYPGVAQALTEARAYAQVAIMTGRTIEKGAALVNVEGLTYVGTHGAEWSAGLPSTHEIQLIPEALPFIEAARQLMELARQKLGHIPGILLESKQIGGSIHYRLVSDPEQTRETILDVLRLPAQEAHFVLSEGKRVVDLKPAASSISKGTALRTFVERFKLAGVVFAGDDRTDLDAILELERLQQAGFQSTAIVVQATDTLPALLEHADTIVQGVDNMARLLNEMVGQLSRSQGER